MKKKFTTVMFDIE